MAQIPGLRHRVEEALTGIIETAVEFAHLTGQHAIGSSTDPLRLHVGNYVVWYFLDAVNSSAKVVYVEMLSRATVANDEEETGDEEDGSQVA